MRPRLAVPQSTQEAPPASEKGSPPREPAVFEVAVARQGFDVHGVRTRVTSVGLPALTAVCRFLHPFLDPNAVGTVACRVRIAPREGRRPPESASYLCDLGYFRAFAPSAGERVAVVPGTGWGRADLESGTAELWLDAWTPCDDWRLTRLLFFPLWAQLMKAAGSFTLHGAGVVRGGRALIFPATSMSGKSVLTCNLTRRGYALLGDDTQFLTMRDGAVVVGGFPEAIALRPTAAGLVPGLAELPVDRDGRLLLEPLAAGIDLASTAAPGIIAFPRISGDRYSRAAEMERGEALRELFAHSLFLADSATSGEHFAVLAALVERSACVRLEVGTDGDDLACCLHGLEEAL